MGTAWTILNQNHPCCKKLCSVTEVPSPTLEALSTQQVVIGTRQVHTHQQTACSHGTQEAACSHLHPRITLKGRSLLSTELRVWCHRLPLFQGQKAGGWLVCPSLLCWAKQVQLGGGGGGQVLGGPTYCQARNSNWVSELASESGHSCSEQEQARGSLFPSQPTKPHATASGHHSVEELVKKQPDR